MVLAKQEIRQLIHGSPPLVENWLDLEEQLQPNGFDLTVKEIASFASSGSLGVGKDRSLPLLSPVEFPIRSGVDLHPGCYLITYNEIVNIPLTMMALGRPRSSLLRCGATVGAAVWDAGYSGRSQSLLTVQNPHGFHLERNARVLQLVFLVLQTSTEDGYRGRYQRENL